MDTSFSNQDLRAANRDSKRDADHQHKWENGEAWGPGRSNLAHPRPGKNFYAALRKPKLDKQYSINQARTNRKRDIMYDTTEATDSSADEEIEPSAASEPDVGITYSYDAEKGPGHGSQVLGYALDQAVELFENKETEKLVKNEYLMLDTEGEPVILKAGKKKAIQHVQCEEDEDYEFL